MHIYEIETAASRRIGAGMTISCRMGGRAPGAPRTNAALTIPKYAPNPKTEEPW